MVSLLTSSGWIPTHQQPPEVPLWSQGDDEALAQFVSGWEAEHGLFTAEELARAERQPAEQVWDDPVFCSRRD